MTGDTARERSDGTLGTKGTNSATGRTKKELAGRAGVSTKTLRRIEKGERVSPKTRSKVKATLDAGQDEASPIRIAHLDALRRLRAIADVSDLEWLCRAAAIIFFYMAPVMVFLFVAAAEKIIRRPEIAWDQLTVACYFAFVLYVAGSVISFRVHRRCGRRDRKMAASLAPAVLEGIRMGSIRYLQAHEERLIREAVGARALGEAKRAAPRHVQVA